MFICLKHMMLLTKIYYIILLHGKKEGSLLIEFLFSLFVLCLFVNITGNIFLRLNGVTLTNNSDIIVASNPQKAVISNMGERFVFLIR